MNWKQTISSIGQEGQDAFCLISHASYLVRTDGVLWAVDPRLRPEYHQMADAALPSDLAALQAVFLTHLHPDHYDERWIELLSSNDILWVFPAFMPPETQKKWRGKLPRCLFVAAGDVVCLGGMTVRVFDSIHFDVFQGKKVGVPEIGYEAFTPRRTLLFPGDVRNYEYFPDARKKADELFSHVWLGRQAALAPSEKMIEAFCRYFVSSKAKRLWLTHLEDPDRDPCDRWTRVHAERARARMLQIAPDLSIEIPVLGQVYTF